MTNQQHTPEHAWKIDGDLIVCGDEIVAQAVCNDRDWDADARRIVAAVNACTGIHTDELERCRKLIFYPNTDSHRGTE